MGKIFLKWASKMTVSLAQGPNTGTPFGIEFLVRNACIQGRKAFAVIESSKKYQTLRLDRF